VLRVEQTSNPFVVKLLQRCVI